MKNVRREYPALPVVAVSALVCHAERILLIRRGYEPAQGQWSVPGGVLRLGENLHEGAAREVQEETGVAVEVGEVAMVGENIVYDNEGRVIFHYVLIDYWARPLHGEACAASDAAEVAWVDWQQARDYDLTWGTRRLLETRKEQRPTWK